jgi:hypothetical protein
LLPSSKGKYLFGKYNTGENLDKSKEVSTIAEPSAPPLDN